MNQPIDQRIWWELHLRKARGETLSEQEEQFYSAEATRQDQEASPAVRDLDDLKKLREQTLALAGANRELQGRVQELEAEIRRSMDG